jgi:uncharacterized membrane protein
MTFKRALRHLMSTGWALRRAFDAAGLQAIERAIATAERAHGGEIRFAIEAQLSPLEVFRGIAPRARAVEAFAQLGVWDTEANNGVLIYVLWADHDVEIVADRGFNNRVTPQEWEDVCRGMEARFAQGEPVDAVITGIQAIAQIVTRHFPATDRNELPDKPVVL